MPRLVETRTVVCPPKRSEPAPLATIERAFPRKVLFFFARMAVEFLDWREPAPKPISRKDAATSTVA